MAEAFSYAILRLVPDIERGERVNVGVVVFCRPLDYLGARTAIDEDVPAPRRATSTSLRHVAISRPSSESRPETEVRGRSRR